MKKSLVSKWAVLAAGSSTLLLSACSGSVDMEGESETNAGQIGQTSAAVTGLHPLGLIRDSASLVASRKLTMAPPTSALPSSVDLSASLPPVGDQGAQGSCVGWATGYYAKTFHEVGQGFGFDQTSTLFQWSPAWVYNQINHGVDNGATFSDAYNLFLQKGGDTLKFFPYTDTNFTNQPDADSLGRAARFVAHDWSTLTVSADTFKQVLSGGNVVNIGVEVFPDFDSLSAANPTYDSSAGTDRGRHALTLYGYDDSKQAFHLRNSWGTGWGIQGDGWIGYNFISDGKLALDAYVFNDQAPSAPSVQHSLYLTQSGKLYRVDENFGDWVRLGTATWTGATAITSVGSSLYIVQANQLWKVDPSTGRPSVLGNGNWSGPAFLATVGNQLYAVQASQLMSVNLTTGSTTTLGSPTAWPRVTAFAGIANYFYVVQDGKLWQVNATTNAITQLGTADWSGPVALTAASGGTLFAIRANEFDQVNTSNGSVTTLGAPGTWANVTSFTALDGSLYATQDVVGTQKSHLIRADRTGVKTYLAGTGGWGGTIQLTAL